LARSSILETFNSFNIVLLPELLFWLYTFTSKFEIAELVYLTSELSIVAHTLVASAKGWNVG